MSSEDNYDLKKSGEKFQLYPVLKDKKGNTINLKKEGWDHFSK